MNRKLRRTIALAALAVSLWVLISGCYAESTTSTGASSTTTTGSTTGSAPPPAATPMSTDSAATPAGRDTSGGQH